MKNMGAKPAFLVYFNENSTCFLWKEAGKQSLIFHVRTIIPVVFMKIFIIFHSFHVRGMAAFT